MDSRDFGRGAKNSLRNTCAISELFVIFVISDIFNPEIKAKLAWLDLSSI